MNSATVDSFTNGAHFLAARDGAAWHPSAPLAVRRAYRRGKAAAGWSAWVRYLARCRRVVEPADLPGASPDALLWALPADVDAESLRRRIDALRPPPARRPRGAHPSDSQIEAAALEWLGEAVGRGPSRAAAIESLAWARRLRGLALRISAEAWWPLVDYLTATAREARRLPLTPDPLLHQLLCGELPLALACALPEIKPCRDLAVAARRALGAGLDELLDGQGLPHADHLDLLRPLLACWTRCRAMGDAAPGGCWRAAAEGQYQWLVRHALRLARPDGAHVFAPPSDDGEHDALLRAALGLGGRDDDLRIARLALPKLIARRTANGKHRSGRRSGTPCLTPPKRPALLSADGRLPKPSNHSPWAAVAVLRSDWTPSSPALTVSYAGRATRIEAAAAGDVLLSGEWEFDVRFDGRPAPPRGDWEEICWHSDRDVDYLELEIDLEEGLHVQRHCLLAREDRFLYVADAVLGRRPGRIEYRGRLPLWPGVAFRGERESREGYLVGRRKRLGLVMPLALPEWRAEPANGEPSPRGGELAQRGGALELSQAGEGPNLFAPLWIDLDRRRIARQRTWRQLTVAAWRQVVARETAAGYRVRVGAEQWLVYRSLAERDNRTLLGHNLSTDMLVGRFDRSGEVEPLIEIE